jgi:hypothetical protein
MSGRLKGSDVSNVRQFEPRIQRQELEDRRSLLERRLEDGYRRIDEALADGQDVAEWERFWIRLLGEYEALCDDLAQAA